MITSQVRHHTHLDLSTCRVCSVKHDDNASVLPPILVRSLPLARAWYPYLLQVLYPYPLLVHVVLLSFAYIYGLGLCHFSALVCELAVENGGVPGY